MRLHLPSCLLRKDQHKLALSFLEEERALLNTIAHHLSLAIEKKEASDRKAEMENQLRHSDRLAKIGQLTAGVAHEVKAITTASTAFFKIDRGQAMLNRSYPAPFSPNQAPWSKANPALSSIF